MDSTYEIDFDALYREGYRGIIFDIDNTLVPHGAPADERAKKLFAHLKELDFPVVCCQTIKNRVLKCLTMMCRCSIFLKQENQSVLVMKRQWSGWERTGATPCLSEIRSLRIFMEQTVQGSVRSWSAISIQKKRYRLY